MKNVKCTICSSEKISAYSRFRQFEMGKCSRCGHVFAMEIPTEEELQLYYSKYAYSGSTTISPITIKRFKEIIQSFEPFRKNNNLLDVGCGRGELLEVAKEMGWNVFGSEYSAEAIKILNEKGISAFEGDVSEIQEKLEFDVIVSIEVIEHVKHPTANIAAIKNLLRENGMLYITTPNIKSLSGRILKNRWRVISFPEHLNYFSARSMRCMLKEQQFGDITIKTTGFTLSALKQIFRGRKNANKIEHHDGGESFREAAESKVFAKLAKSIINLILNVLRKGDTLKISVIKK